MNSSLAPITFIFSMYTFFSRLFSVNIFNFIKQFCRVISLWASIASELICAYSVNLNHRLKCTFIHHNYKLSVFTLQILIWDLAIISSLKCLYFILFWINLVNFWSLHLLLSLSKVSLKTTFYSHLQLFRFFRNVYNNFILSLFEQKASAFCLCDFSLEQILNICCKLDYNLTQNGVTIFWIARFWTLNSLLA